MPDPTFADEFGRAVRARGLSLDRLHVRLTSVGVPVSIATLSYWQSGRSRPTRTASLRAVVELERILRVRPGSLTSLLGDRGVGIVPDPGPLIPDADIAQGIVEDLGLDLADGLARISSHDITTIGPTRGEVSQLTRQLFRAERDGVTRWPAIFHQDAEEPTTPSVDALSSCTVGRVVTVPDRHLCVAEMHLPRVLSEGEYVMVEYLVSWGSSGSASFRAERYVAVPMRELVLQVNFHPDAVPRRVQRMVRQPVPGDPAHSLEMAAVVRVDAGVAQAVWLDVDPGVYGLYWSWDEASRSSPA